MSVSMRHVFRQGPMIKSLFGVAVSAMGQRFRKTPTLSLPSRWTEQTLPPRAPKLVVDYIRWTGGDFGVYDQSLPAHFFPQWGIPLAAGTLSDIPYPLTGVLNQGCTLTRNGQLSKDKPLHVKARLEEIDDNGERARLHQRVITGTDDAPEALVADIYAVVKLKKSKNKQKREAPTVPTDATTLGSRTLQANAGLEFALLTGDFNPIHWLSPAAKAAGFKYCILHGFASMALTIEQLNAYLANQKQDPWTSVDVRFIKPLVLPTTATFYVSEGSEEEGTRGALWLTNEKGEVCMLGSYK